MTKILDFEAHWLAEQGDFEWDTYWLRRTYLIEELRILSENLVFQGDKPIMGLTTDLERYYQIIAELNIQYIIWSNDDPPTDNGA